MDKETKEYFDQRLFGLATKEDIEKLRQETKAAIRQWKEENNTNIVEWKQEIKTDIEQLRRESSETMGPFREEVKEGLKKIGEKTQSALDQSIKNIESSFQNIKGQEGIGEQIKQTVAEIAALHGKIKEGFTEVKEELGSMIKFSYSDLEKKINALEARIKALEKMIFP